LTQLPRSRINRPYDIVNSTMRILLFFLLLPLTAGAAPVGADLERACTAALRQGFNSEPGAACIWYGTPCACDKVSDATARPRSCPPANLDDATRARALLTGFAAHPELRLVPVPEAADRILAERYPCTESTEQQPPRE
jgi:hypothetical protein